MYELPIHILDQRSMTQADEEILSAMTEYPPATNLKKGDLVYLTETTPYTRISRIGVPRLWQVRLVISAWTFELHRIAQDPYHKPAGIDYAIGVLEAQNFPRSKWRKPIVYAHGYPHGNWPDTASWFPERVLRKITFREATQPWERILDEAQAPFRGYDASQLVVPYTFDLAPDMYSAGENLGRPFSFEQDTAHTIALLGGEEILFRPLKKELDREHDIFR
jgi:hypothetical protein